MGDWGGGGVNHSDSIAGMRISTELGHLSVFFTVKNCEKLGTILAQKKLKKIVDKYFRTTSYRRCLEDSCTAPESYMRLNLVLSKQKKPAVFMFQQILVLIFYKIKMSATISKSRRKAKKPLNSDSNFLGIYSIPWATIVTGCVTASAALSHNLFPFSAFIFVLYKQCHTWTFRIATVMFTSGF